MIETTTKYQTLSDHVVYADEPTNADYREHPCKTVCVTTCLNFLGIDFNSYKYTSSPKHAHYWRQVVRRAGFSLRRWKPAFEKEAYPTMTRVRKRLRQSEFGADDFFLVSGIQKTCGHLMVLNGKGQIVIDTAPGKKWHIRQVYRVTKK